MNYRTRDPDTLKDVAAELRELLGVERCALLIARSVSWVNRVCDIDEPDKMFSIEQMVALDLACAATGKGSPFETWYQTRKSKATQPPKELELVDAVLQVDSTIGLLNNLVVTARAAQSPGGKKLTQAEKLSIKQMAKRVRKCLDEVDGAVHTGGDRHG